MFVLPFLLPTVIFSAYVRLQSSATIRAIVNDPCPIASGSFSTIVGHASRRLLTCSGGCGCWVDGELLGGDAWLVYLRVFEVQPVA